MSLEQDIQDYADCLVDLENSGYTDCYRKTEGIDCIYLDDIEEDVSRDYDLDYEEED